MLTSFFGKSKPINFIFVAVYMLVFYAAAVFMDIGTSSFQVVLREVVVLLFFLLSMVILNFIAKRNELTKRNSYKIILFAAFSCMFLGILENNNVLLANFFVLLALRRVISLRSQREVIKKIFDASFWVVIASLFYFWAILFLVFVFFGIFIYARQNFRFWLLPFLAFLICLSLVTTGSLLLNDSFYTFSEWFQEINMDFSAYGQPAILVPVSFLFALFLWALFPFLALIQKVSANLKPSLILILLTLLISLAVAILGANKNGSELLFLFPPMAIVVANYYQIKKDKWFEEILLITIVAMPVFLLIGF